MSVIYKVAAASVQGRGHKEINKNNQDSFCYLNNNGFVAVVCDGCNSGKHSEVGSKIGSSILVNEVKRVVVKIGFGEEVETILKHVKDNVLAQLLLLANFMGDDVRRVVNDYFLFTVVGVFEYGDKAVFFSLGDGVIVVNGEVMEIGPFKDNQPPYLGYSLCGTSLISEEGALDFKIIKIIDVADLESALIGTDGVMDLIRSSGKKIPCKDEKVFPATWDNIFNMVSKFYPGIVFPQLIVDNLKTKSLQEIETQIGYRFLDIKSEDDPRFMTFNRFCFSVKNLVDYRAFLYHTIHLKEQYSGDGWTCDENGKKLLREYIYPNRIIAKIKNATVVDIKM